ncbi:sulfurtransferase TusA family protein [bacterium]|nr:sulfurtransferase TusA family protein [bacterium]RQV98244.1 MAG: sulfurtransferase TusA family protein [bacterium]
MDPDIIVDVIGETCPVPLVEMRKAVLKAEKGKVIEVKGTHPASKQEIPMAVDSLGLKLLKTEESDGIWHIYIRR